VDGSGQDTCTGILWPSGEGLEVVHYEFTPPNAVPERVTVHVTATGFTHPTWRVDVVRHQP
jgi:hypothetical protein